MKKNKSLEKSSLLLEIATDISSEDVHMWKQPVTGTARLAAIETLPTMLMEQLPDLKTFLLAIWYLKCQQTANLKREKITFLIRYIVLNWILLWCHVLLCHFTYWLLTGWNHVIFRDCNATKSNLCYWKSSCCFSFGVLEMRGEIDS